MLAVLHVDEVHDDQATQVAQTHLASHFVSRFEVGAEGGFLDVAATGGARRVHVHRHQRFGVVDHDGATRRQVHRAAEGRFDLMLDLEAGKQRRIVAVAFDPIFRLGHDVVHELLGLFIDVVGVDQDLADVGGEVIADGADDQRGLLIDQVGTLADTRGVVNGGPQLEHVVQVPLQLGRGATDASGAGDQAHPLGVLELVHRLFELFALVTLDATAHATATRVVGHQHQVTTGQRDKGGQGRALVAALFLLDLDQQLLAFLDHVLDAGRANLDPILEVLARDFLERQETVALFAVIDETGFQGRFDAGDDRFVDIALALFTPFDFGFEVEQFLSVNNGQAPFFGLRGVDQHALHVFSTIQARPDRDGAGQTSTHP